jgi:putative DNA primase/helicase
MNRAQSALQFISPIERDVWVSMGMALQSEFGDAARDIWMDWSRGADSFRELDARSVWKSFKGAGVTIASLYHEAKINGWRDEGFQKPTAQQIEQQRQAAAERQSKEGQQRIRLAQAAAKKADWILSQCKREKHAYLDSKGFREMEGLVWWPTESENLLCIPMYFSGALVGVQMIDREGNKKFLENQASGRAEYCIDAGGVNGVDWWVEGFASGLSLRECLHALKQRYRVHVTFTAGNLKRMAHSGLVVADHDLSKTGEAAAIATGLPYWMPPTVGTDINDFHKQHGTFRASQVLGKWLRELREDREWYGS